jgi:hypothetical protein
MSLHDDLTFCGDAVKIGPRFFLTAWMLPFLIGGLCLLFVAGQKKSLVMLSAIPGYYLSSHALFSH